MLSCDLLPSRGSRPVGDNGRNPASRCASRGISRRSLRPEARPDHFRVLFFTCAGGSESAGYLATALRNRMMRRALSFEPQALVANGDHVYWDLHAPRVPPARRDNAKLQSFNRSALVFGDRNETVLKLAAGPQITLVYGTDSRSTMTLPPGLTQPSRPERY